MRAGLLMVFQNFMDSITDREAYERDVYLAGLAEPLGFDTLSGVEHHFFNYAMAPDNTTSTLGGSPMNRGSTSTRQRLS